MITVYKTGNEARLPWVTTWRVKKTRPTSERQNLSGGMIRQSGTKADSTGTASYEGPVPEADAIKLRTIDEDYASCFLADGLHLYEAEIDCEIGNTVRGGKVQVSMGVKIVRQIL